MHVQPARANCCRISTANSAQLRRSCWQASCSSLVQLAPPVRTPTAMRTPPASIHAFIPPPAADSPLVPVAPLRVIAHPERHQHAHTTSNSAHSLSHFHPGAKRLCSLGADASRKRLIETHATAAHRLSQLRPCASLLIQKGISSVHSMKSTLVAWHSRLSSKNCR